MFCVMCGKQIEPDTSFCVHCGHKFNAAPPPEPLKRRSWIPLILIFTFTSVISLGILVWALFYEDTSSYSADIVGRWVCSTDEGFGTYWIFNTDNTCVYYVPGMYGNARTGYTDTLDSRYRISGNILTFTHSDGVSTSWRISINGDELKLYMSDGQLFDIYWKDHNYHAQSPVFQSQSADSNTPAVQSAEVHNTAREMDRWQGVYADFLLNTIQTSTAGEDLGSYMAAGYPTSPFFYLHDIDKSGIPELIIVNPSENSCKAYTFADDSISYLGNIQFYQFGGIGVPVDKAEGLYSDTGYKGHYGTIYYYSISDTFLTEQIVREYDNQQEGSSSAYSFDDFKRLDYYEVTGDNIKKIVYGYSSDSAYLGENSWFSVGESDVTTAMRESDSELFDAMFGGIGSDDGNTDGNATNDKGTAPESDARIDSEILKRALLRVLDEDDKRISYEGDMINGVSHGFGFAKYNDGSMYEGEFQYGLKNGKGIYYFVSGDTYDGQFVDGSMSGYGTYYWANGKRYTGEFPGNGTLFANGVTIAGTAIRTDTGWSFSVASTSPSTEFITIKGEQYSVSLTGQLYLGDKELNDEDIKPLAYMVNITELNLDNNQIRDLSPLAGLTNLTALTLDGNQISDLSHLAGLTNLTGLSLMSNQISDLSPLANLTNLEWIELNGNQISNLLPLAGLPKLTSVSLYSNRATITDWSPVAHISGVGGRPNINNPLKVQSSPSVERYNTSFPDYPDIPDFGAFLNIKLLRTTESYDLDENNKRYDTTIYMYNYRDVMNAGNGLYEEYFYLIESLGITQQSPSKWEGNGYHLQINVMDDYMISVGKSAS